MKQKFISGLLILLTIIVLILIPSCKTSTSTVTTTVTSTAPATVPQPSPATTPVKANWWDKFGEPKYGGTITLRVNDFSNLIFDPWDHPVFSGQWLLHFDYLFTTDWTVDRSKWAFNVSLTPEEYIKGSLAEKWEQKDPQTLVITLRKGVRFQNKPPVNGRELVADDIVYHYHRLCGIGSGFMQPSPFWTYFTDLVESVSSVDKNTVIFKFKQPGIINFIRLADTFQYNCIEAPEVSQQYNDCSDWKNAVGTGPWILTNYIEGNSLNFEKNPNYWGYDERHPANRLPYANKITIVCIPDSATALGAVRTGKIDILTGVNWQQAMTTKKSNPEIEQVMLPKAGCDVLFNLNNAPFTNIKVRKALQMSLNRQEIARSHYGGIVEGTPCGQIHPIYKDFAFTYDLWPQSLKDEYSYNPEAAKKMLAEAGYPSGFKTNIVAPNTGDTELLQIIKSYFKDIGVDMEIKLYDMATYTNIQMTAKHDQMTWSEMECGSTNFPFQSLLSTTSYWTNPSTVNDPVYDEMTREFTRASSFVELAQMTREADKYALEKHWKVRLFPIISYNLYQPYLKGYSGEVIDGMGGNMDYFARWWIAK